MLLNKVPFPGSHGNDWEGLSKDQLMVLKGYSNAEAAQSPQQEQEQKQDIMSAFKRCKLLPSWADMVEFGKLFFFVRRLEPTNIKKHKSYSTSVSKIRS